MILTECVIAIETADLYSVIGAARELGRPPLTIYRWVNKGKINAIKLGGVLFVPRSEVERIRAEQSQAGQAK